MEKRWGEGYCDINGRVISGGSITEIEFEGSSEATGGTSYFLSDCKKKLSPELLI